MVTLIADSNTLRSDGLRSYLCASRKNTIALSDLTLIEMRKDNALSTSRESLKIVAEYPQQCYVLRRTDQVLEEKISGVKEASRLIDYEATNQLRDLSSRLRASPSSHDLCEEMQEHESNARVVMDNLTEQVSAFSAGFVSVSKDFSSDELGQIRTGVGILSSTRDKLYDLVKQTMVSSLMNNHEVPLPEVMRVRDVLGRFEFRWSLCMTVYYIKWIRDGRQTQKKLSLWVNDFVDMQVVAMGTFFNGVLSADKRMQEISASARTLIRSYGGYVGRTDRRCLGLIQS